MRLFIFGAGYSGKAVARELGGSADWIGGTARSQEKLAIVAKSGIEPLLFDGEALSPPVAVALGKTTHLLVSIAPAETGDPVLHIADNVIERHMRELRWIGYLSTVGVYGDHAGAWVDEAAVCRPVSKRSMLRLAAEEAWRSTGARMRLPVAVLRLAGIYGPGRNAFVNLQSGAAKRVSKPGQVFNRIHVDDVAGAVAHLAIQGAGGALNISDDEPAPPQDVVDYAARLMGMQPPPEIPFENADLSPMARSFYGENKRVSNNRLKASGYQLRYPDYRCALEAMWRSGDWRG